MEDETTLLSMMLPCSPSSMLLTGIPYSESSLSETTTGEHHMAHRTYLWKKNPVCQIEKNLGFAMGLELQNCKQTL